MSLIQAGMEISTEAEWVVILIIHRNSISTKIKQKKKKLKIKRKWGTLITNQSIRSSELLLFL